MWSSEFCGIDLAEYGFNMNSPSPLSPNDSSSGRSFSSDPMDAISDEDFLTQLSNDLDIPSLLNPSEDDGLLNAYLDKSADEMLSGNSSPSSHSSNPNLNDLPLDFLNHEVDIPISPKSEPKSEPVSDGSTNGDSPRSSSRGSNSPVKRRSPSLGEPSRKLQKTVPIKPKIEPALPCIAPSLTPVISGFNSNSIVFIKNELPNAVQTNSAPKMLVLNNQPIVPVTTSFKTGTTTIPQMGTTTIPQIGKPIHPPMIIENRGINRNIDPKTLKRHQRKIKNRESASLSRKKKKDYLNSLEEKIEEVQTENRRLMAENAALKERLSLYENVAFDGKFPGFHGKNAKLALCVFLLVVGFNLDFLRGPFSFRGDVQPLKQVPKILNHHSRGLLWAVDDGGGEAFKNQTEEVKNSSINYFTMCPVYVNQTESARLVLELEKWIGKPIGPQKKDGLKLEEKPVTPRNITRLRKKKIKIDSPVASLSNFGTKNSINNEIQIFTPTLEQLYSEFFEAINRRNDTFYVVSFNEQHMLLPALYHNKTRRPKMSFLIPSMINDSSAANLFPLMQIDCEVLDTKLVNVKYGSIPTEYRSGNVTKPSVNKNNESNVKSDNVSRYNHYGKKPYKPYFLYKKLTKNQEELLP